MRSSFPAARLQLQQQVLKLLEERGHLRRGYFVAGLGAAQFALPGAVDRLRSRRDDSDEVLVLAATDPANPFGASLSWPENSSRPSRQAGAFVVIDGGELTMYVERGGKSLTTFGATARSPRWASALTSLVLDGRLRSWDIARVDGAPIRESPVYQTLLSAGFKPSYRGASFRP